MGFVNVEINRLFTQESLKSAVNNTVVSIISGVLVWVNQFQIYFQHFSRISE